MPRNTKRKRAKGRQRVLPERRVKDESLFMGASGSEMGGSSTEGR
jgi:hypothetical protein